MSKLKVVSRGFSKMICLLHSDLHYCYINLRKNRVPSPFHRCLWSIEHSQNTLSPLHTQTHTCVIISSPDDLTYPYKTLPPCLFDKSNKSWKKMYIYSKKALQCKQHTACKARSFTVNKSTPLMG